MRIPRVLPVVGAGIAVRAWLLFGTPYVPGMNGGYYLVQARALLERGTLGIPDMPLLFHLHASLAWLLGAAGGLEQAHTVMLAVKLCDAVLPAFVAWPVYALLKRWSAARGQSHAVPLAVAALACMATPFISVVGDLQKNSLALLWLGMLLPTLHAFLDAQSLRRGMLLLAVLLLLGLTHVGVLGAALVLLAAVLPIFLVLQRRRIHWRALLPWMGAGVVVLALAAALVLWKFDPARMQRLLTALTQPLQFASDGKQPPAGPDGGMQARQWLQWLGFIAMTTPGLIIVWRTRATARAADTALIAGATLAVLAMTGPWFGEDKSVRFMLIALLPALIVAGFALLHVATPWRRTLLIALALLAGLGGTALRLPRGAAAVLSDAAMQELQAVAPMIGTPARTLVTAQHGVEWWTAWFLHTHIAQPDALSADDWQRYEQVLFLEVKSGLQMDQLAGGGGPGPGGVPTGPPGPPAGFGSGPPPDARPDGNGAPPPPPQGRGPGGPSPMMSASIPSDAVLLHDGVCIRLARVLVPPQSVLGKLRSVDK